jgi:hypothetical protein
VHDKCVLSMNYYFNWHFSLVQHLVKSNLKGIILFSVNASLDILHSGLSKMLITFVVFTLAVEIPVAIYDIGL